MKIRRCLPCFALLCVASIASASPITYTITANTSSISGKTGSLDFNFNPGPLTTQSASAQVVNFSSNGSFVGSATLTGDATGSLPGTATFDNETGFNDYFQAFTFGSDLSFDVTLSGPALTSPDGASTSGSEFAFSMFSNPEGTAPTLTSDSINGFAYTVDINLDGTTTATDYIVGTTSPVPEPGSIFLLSSGCVFLYGLSKLRANRWHASRIAAH